MNQQNIRDWLNHISYDTSKQRKLDRDAVENHLVAMELANPSNLPILDKLMSRIVSLGYFDIQGVGGWSLKAPGFHIQLPPPHEKVYVVLAVIPLTSLGGIRARLQQRIPGCTNTKEKLLPFQAEIQDNQGIESVIRYLIRFT